MAMNETQLKDTIKGGSANLYVFYGAESYLVEQYARLVIRETVEEGFDAFNLQQFDGQEVSIAELEDAVEALPMMTDRKCVVVRDLDPCSGDMMGAIFAAEALRMKDKGGRKYNRAYRQGKFGQKK